mmetsp:Transcript_3955/g.9332  ORF Transcript_3955/g.9332 Transcript_3955/m.9332 type:complete len:210 (+) Transcript_3955:899-1528(+)
MHSRRLCIWVPRWRRRNGMGSLRLTCIFAIFVLALPDIEGREMLLPLPSCIRLLLLLILILLTLLLSPRTSFGSWGESQGPTKSRWKVFRNCIKLLLLPSLRLLSLSLGLFFLSTFPPGGVPLCGATCPPSFDDIFLSVLGLVPALCVPILFRLVLLIMLLLGLLTVLPTATAPLVFGFAVPRALLPSSCFIFLLPLAAAVPTCRLVPI